jgi:hypothetical protein
VVGHVVDMPERIEIAEAALDLDAHQRTFTVTVALLAPSPET